MSTVMETQLSKSIIFKLKDITRRGATRHILLLLCCCCGRSRLLNMILTSAFRHRRHFGSSYKLGPSIASPTPIIGHRGKDTDADVRLVALWQQPRVDQPLSHFSPKPFHKHLCTPLSTLTPTPFHAQLPHTVPYTFPPPQAPQTIPQFPLTYPTTTLPSTPHILHPFKFQHGR